jgi:hypothetical protein
MYQKHIAVTDCSTTRQNLNVDVIVRADFSNGGSSVSNCLELKVTLLYKCSPSVLMYI